MSYIQFLQSTQGAAAVLLGAVLVLSALGIWARQPRHADRVLVLGTAAVLTGLVALVYILALLAGWWSGAYFTLSPIVQGAILLPLSLLFGTTWLAGYRWLGDHTRQPVQTYLAVSVVLVLAVAIAHRLNIGQGQILVGPGYAVVVEAVFGMLILWVPVLVYEGLRRNIEQFEPMP
ncbi:MAG TPA: hypothetical protein VF937_12435 [Chloroflexota bacterium]